MKFIVIAILAVLLSPVHSTTAQQFSQQDSNRDVVLVSDNLDIDTDVVKSIKKLAHEVVDLHASDILSNRHYSMLYRALHNAVVSYKHERPDHALKNMEQFVRLAERLLELNRYPDEVMESLLEQAYVIIPMIEDNQDVEEASEAAISPSLELQAIPESFLLEQNYPNPFNPTTTIQYSVSEDASIKLAVYDMLGKEIQVLVNDFKEVGTYQVTLDASNLPSGMYLYKLDTPAGAVVRQMTLMK